MIEIRQGDCRAVLVELEAESFSACVTDLAAGTAAEHLVCADLLLAGYRAFRADQNCPYDVAVEHGGKLVRVQVKATRQFRRVPERGYTAYMWHVRRAGKNGQRTYQGDEFDIIALVALDIRQIAYLSFKSISKNVIHLRAPGHETSHANRRHRPIDQYPFTAALLGLTDA